MENAKCRVKHFAFFILNFSFFIPAFHCRWNGHFPITAACAGLFFHLALAVKSLIDSVS